MLPLTALVTAVISFIALSNWRQGVAGVILVGLLQDPFRKLTPGVPSYYVLWAMVVFGIVAMVAVMRKETGRFHYLFLHDRTMRSAWQLFIGIVLLQALHALVRWGNPLLPVLGLIFYFGPLVALLVAIGYARNERMIKKFMITYVVIMVPAALTVFLSLWYSDNWPVLREIGSFVGRQLIIYDQGTALDSHPGIFRVGEIAAWHAATAASFLLILAIQNKSVAFRVFVGIVIVFLIGAIILTGRRKMLMTLTIFLVVQWALLALFRKGSGRQTVTLLILGITGSMGLTLLDPSSESHLYLQRGISVFEDAGERFQSALDLLWSATVRSEGIGLGAGVTAQGSQYVGGMVAAAGGSAEAGIGKIVVELGLPGAAVILFLVIALARRIFRNLAILKGVDERLLFYSVSFSSILIANIATFAVASQLYGDLFILIILGFVAGMLFSVNLSGLQLAHYQQALKKQRRAAAVATQYASVRN